MTGRIKEIEQLIEQFRQRTPIRSRSLIFTVFGDAISQHGGSVWLGSLIRSLEPLGINERLVRTSVFRLVREGWLSSKRVGRCSYYQFTRYGMREYERAAKRIYSAERHGWDGQWSLLLPVAVPEEQRAGLRQSLKWQGFGQLGSGLYLHPSLDRESLDELLVEMGLRDKVIIMDAHAADAQSLEVLREAVYESWQLASLAEHYQEFLEQYRPVLKAVSLKKSIPVETCFLVRTLLIHDYRKVLLNDMDIPHVLLPSDWPGDSALRLVKNLYRHVCNGAEAYIQGSMESAEGPLPPPIASYYGRLGGLPKVK